MLFNVLSGHPDLWSLYGESQHIIDRFFPVSMVPGTSEFVGGEDVGPETAKGIERAFFEAVGNAGSSHFALSNRTAALMRTSVGRKMLSVPGLSRLRLSMVFRRVGRREKQAPVRMVEKTPENCFRIQVLDRVFDNALFVHIVRDPRSSIASIYSGWTQSTEFRRFPFPAGFALAGYEAESWCFGLLPGWESLNGASLMEVCARQWLEYNRCCLRDLPDDPDRVLRIGYEELTRDPGPALDRIAEWGDLDRDAFSEFRDGLPVVNTATKPEAEKWRSLESQIAQVENLIREEALALGYRI